MQQILDFYSNFFSNVFSYFIELPTTYSVPFSIIVGLTAVLFVVMIGVFFFKRLTR